MQISHLRKIYEKYPYPKPDKTGLTKEDWKLAPMDWMRALWKPGHPKFAPRRILVAGCGTGREAFALQRRFPEARIVAIDLSPRSISIAKVLQKRVRAPRKIRFLIANLASPKLRKTFGNNFDFISCHGVLSYVPAPERAFMNLASCLARDGALYLGVNGPAHFSVRGRSFLPAFGIDVNEPPDDRAWRRLLKLWDVIEDSPGAIKAAEFSDGYLAGDFFGPLIHNLPLVQWLRRTAAAPDLHFRGSYTSWRPLRAAMGEDFHKLFFPKSRAAVGQLLDSIAPVAFHRMLFTRERDENPKWEKRADLRGCYPLLTGLYAARLPKKSARSSRSLTPVTFKSAALNTRLDWKMPDWELEILRRSDGQRTLGEILQQQNSRRIPEHQLQEQLYILHQLLVVTLLPRPMSFD